MISILIADDHQLFRDGVSSLINSISNFKVISQSSNGVEVIEQLKLNHVDLVLLDINMPEMDGIEAAEIIRKDYPDIKIIMLSMLTDRETIEKVLKIGVQGYLPKDTGKVELEEAITKVMKGSTHYNEQITHSFMSGLQSKNVSQPVRLTPREKEVLKLICEEFTSQEIADKLFISFNTVETHRKNLLHKIGCKNSLGLLKFAIENKIYNESKKS